MAITGVFPPELVLPKADSGRPVLLAAMTAQSVVVVSAQSSVWCRAARFDPDLNLMRTREIVEASDDERGWWWPRRVVALSEQRILMCNYPSGEPFLHFVPARNLELDPVSLAAAPSELKGAPGFETSFSHERDPQPRDAFPLAGQVLVTHGAAYSNVEETLYVSACPADGPGAPRPWGRLPGEPERTVLGQELRARGLPEYHASIVAGTVAGEELIVAIQCPGRSGSDGHALARLSADGHLLDYRADDRRRIRDATLRLVADEERGHVVLYAKGSLEIVRPDLTTVAAAPAKHPFLSRHRLLCGDGRGRLLWYAQRRRALLITEPRDLQAGDLTAGLDALAAVRR